MDETRVKVVVAVSHVGVMVTRRLLDVVAGLIVVSLTVGNDVIRDRNRGIIVGDIIFIVIHVTQFNLLIVGDILMNCRGRFRSLDVGVLSLSLRGLSGVQRSWKFFVSCSHELVASGNGHLRATLSLGFRGHRFFINSMVSVTADERSRSSWVEARWASDQDGAVIRDRPLINLVRSVV